MNEVVAAVKELRDDFDRLMDAVQRYSVMRGSAVETEALMNLKIVFEENQAKWGGQLPNHCSNVLTVTGAASELATFCNYGLQKDGGAITSCPDLNYLYPIPGDVKRAEDRTILSDSEYKWKVDNWGTKWNTYSDVGLSIMRSEVSDRLIGIQCEFQTAWAPPVGAIQVGSKKFPSLNFTLEYAEPGVGFKGVALYKQGKKYFDYTEMECSEEEMDADTYLRMSDIVQIAHITALKEDINSSTLTRHASFEGDVM